MSLDGIALIACLGTIIFGLAATHPLELRAGRWLRIIFSIPLVILIASTFQELDRVRGFLAMWSVGLLGFLWKGPMAHFYSFIFVRLIVGDWNRPTGIRAEFAGPKALFKHGDLEEALTLTQTELEKEPLSYEGLLLLADIHEASGCEKEAIHALEKLSQSPKLTAAQRRFVQSRKEKIQERLLIASLNRR